jgi:hypothetical protein
LIETPAHIAKRRHVRNLEMMGMNLERMAHSFLEKEE